MSLSLQTDLDYDVFRQVQPVGKCNDMFNWLISGKFPFSALATLTSWFTEFLTCLEVLFNQHLFIQLGTEFEF